MKNEEVPEVPPVEPIDRIDPKIQEAAYRNWLNRVNQEKPGDEVDDWIAAERAAQTGFPDLPDRSAPG